MLQLKIKCFDAVYVWYRFDLFRYHALGNRAWNSDTVWALDPQDFKRFDQSQVSAPVALFPLRKGRDVSLALRPVRQVLAYSYTAWMMPSTILKDGILGSGLEVILLKCVSHLVIRVMCQMEMEQRYVNMYLALSTAHLVHQIKWPDACRIPCRGVLPSGLSLPRLPLLWYLVSRSP